MPGISEASLFVDIYTSGEIFQRMQSLDERIPLRWILPGKPDAGFIGTEEASQRRVWVRPKNSTNTRIPAGGHLMVQEAPKELCKS